MDVRWKLSNKSFAGLLFRSERFLYSFGHNHSHAISLYSLSALLIVPRFMSFCFSGRSSSTYSYYFLSFDYFLEFVNPLRQADRKSVV